MPNLAPEPWRVEVVETTPLVRLHGDPEALRGVRIERQTPVLCHFTAALERI